MLNKYSLAHFFYKAICNVFLKYLYFFRYGSHSLIRCKRKNAFLQNSYNLPFQTFTAFDE